MTKTKPTIVVFGSSRPKAGEREYDVAYETGKLLAAAGYRICNGGYGGVMEASARGAKDAGGSTLGVVMEWFSTTANPYIDQKIVTKTLNERLLKLVELGDTYVVLQGGTGTLLELATVWEFIFKHVMKEKPIVVVGDFWSPVVNTLKDEIRRETRESAMNYITIVRSPKECIERLIGKLTLG